MTSINEMSCAHTANIWLGVAFKKNHLSFHQQIFSSWVDFVVLTMAKHVRLIAVMLCCWFAWWACAQCQMTAMKYLLLNEHSLNDDRMVLLARSEHTHTHTQTVQQRTIYASYCQKCNSLPNENSNSNKTNNFYFLFFLLQCFQQRFGATKWKHSMPPPGTTEKKKRQVSIATSCFHVVGGGNGGNAATSHSINGTKYYEMTFDCRY